MYSSTSSTGLSILVRTTFDVVSFLAGALLLLPLFLFLAARTVGDRLCGPGTHRVTGADMEYGFVSGFVALLLLTRFITMDCSLPWAPWDGSAVNAATADDKKVRTRTSRVTAVPRCFAVMLLIIVDVYC